MNLGGRFPRVLSIQEVGYDGQGDPDGQIRQNTWSGRPPPPSSPK